MNDLQEVINNKVQSMIDDKTIDNAIEEGIQKAIESSISDQFRSYGAISKQINKALEEGLQLDLSELPFEVYNKQMMVAVKSRIGNLFQGVACETFMKELDEVLAPVPKTMTIEEFITKIVESWRVEDFDNIDDVDDYATVEIETTSWSTECFSLNMWKKGESKYSSRSTADLALFITQDGTIRISHRASYNLTCFHDHEALVFKMYAAKTVLTGVGDCHPDDLDLCLKPSFID